MLSLIGLAIVFVGVFGGYMLAGGPFYIIAEALPSEMVMIGGAAIGSIVIANSAAVLKQVLKGFGRIVKGPHWKPADYQDLLVLLYQLTKVMKTKGAVAIEAHIDRPDESPIFQAYPKIVADHHARHLICDTMRMMTMDLDDPHQLEDLMERQIDKHHHEELRASDALAFVADGLPAIGIIAAVLGVIKTMGKISEPPEVLGKAIGGALTGTFLGVFLAYGVVGPLAARLKQVIDEDDKFYRVMKDTLVAYLSGNAIQVAVEMGRAAVPTLAQPSFEEFERALEGVPTSG